MSDLRPLLERNRAFAATGAHAGLAMMPRQQVFLVTCLDPRVDPAPSWGSTSATPLPGRPGAGSPSRTVS